MKKDCFEPERIAKCGKNMASVVSLIPIGGKLFFTLKS